MKKKINSVKMGRMFLIVSIILCYVVSIPYNAVSAFAQEETEQVFKPSVTRNQLSSTCGIVPPVGPKSSLIMSVITLCLPGIVEKLMEWKEIKCEEVVCTYEAVKNRLDPSFCEMQASYRTCVFVVGEIFAFPPLSAVEYLRGIISNILANPVGTLFGAVTKQARDFVINRCWIAGSGCNVAISMDVKSAVSIVIVADTLSVIQTIKDMLENGLSGLFGDKPETYCDRMDEIKSEMQKIINSYESSDTEEQEEQEEEEEEEEQEEEEEEENATET